jgi:probable phosphoglycerate mutase
VTVFFLVRHAAHDRLGRVLCGRMPGVHLGAAGQAQADGLAARLAGAGISAIHASPRERAQETAAPLAARLGLPVETADNLDEIDFGAWTGLSFDALDGDPDWRRWNDCRGLAVPPGGETMGAAQQRILGHIEVVRVRNPTGRVALVGHADVIKAALAAVLGMPPDLTLRLEIAPASVSTVEVADWGARVLGVNDTGGVAGAAP